MVRPAFRAPSYSRAWREWGRPQARWDNNDDGAPAPQTTGPMTRV